MLDQDGTLTKDDLKLIPDQRIEGALLPLNSDAHWGFAALSALGFFSLLMFCFPGTSAKPKNLLLTALFTATLGIVFLLAIQWIAAFTQGYWVRGRGIAVLIFYILKFIGFSYNAALRPDTGFLLSFLGFTFGVGLCEEICKALPLLWWQQKHGLPSWRFAALLGLASGIGFGVSEGITYCSDYYNGVSTGGVYLVRFASCVALHAVWAASVAVGLFNLQYKVDTSEPWLVAIRAALLPMVLHGLYDTLLKKEMDAYALATALASFAFLVWQIETARRRFGEEEDTQDEVELPGAGARRAAAMMRV
jgi:RsiW-degrading membrane proteinase PrsW (M82 family)